MVPRAARRLLLGLFLIAAASAVLVLGDRSGSRGGTGEGGAAPAPRIAVVQISSIDSMNTGRDGAIARLEAAGYSRARGTTIDLFNAEGDIGTLNQIAAQVCSASPPCDLVISLSTVGTQAVMHSNKRGLPQVFGLVASPPAIGIPLGPWTEASTRPANVAGFGTLQPAAALGDRLVAMHRGSVYLDVSGAERRRLTETELLALSGQMRRDDRFDDAAVETVRASYR